MIMPQAGRLIAALAAILLLTLPSAVRAGGFSGGIGDTVVFGHLASKRGR